MPTIGDRPLGRDLLAAPDPSRRAYGWADRAFIYPEGSIAAVSSGQVPDLITYWINRFRSWRDPFLTEIAPNLRKYWRLWRNFDDEVNPGPGQQWRDDTIVPEFAKVVATRVPRFVMAQYGGREWCAIEADDPDYEEIVRQVIYKSFAKIGRGKRGATFIEKEIQSQIYCQVMGHVWKYMGWRRDRRPLKTKVPIRGADGKISGWQPVEVISEVYNGLDFEWLPMDSLAINLRGDRRWAIERIVTTLEVLEDEQRSYKEEFGQNLYNPADLELLRTTLPFKSYDNETFQEPRDTEGWPTLNDRADMVGIGPGETPVELWLCWDNRRRTLTKIANKVTVLAHGLSPTPDGMDPYWGVKAVDIPGRVYGESIAHWIGPLCKLQTRMKRARADEVQLNTWQQFIYKLGTITSPRMFMRPGGAMGLQIAPNERIQDNFALLPRRPVFQEAYTEESYIQQQIEATAGADSVSMGVEATQKSRDVTKFEVEQRLLQGSARYQVENLYQDVSDKAVMLHRAFELLQQNLEDPILVSLPQEDEPYPVTLEDLREGVDFKAGGGIYELTKAARRQDTSELVAIAGTPLATNLNAEEILYEFFRAREWPRPERFVKSQEEVMQDALKQQLAAQAMAPPQQTGQQAPVPEEMALPPGGETPLPQLPEEAGMGEGGEYGPEGTSFEPGGMAEEL